MIIGKILILAFIQTAWNYEMYADAMDYYPNYIEVHRVIETIVT